MVRAGRASRVVRGVVRLELGEQFSRLRNKLWRERLVTATLALVLALARAAVSTDSPEKRSPDDTREGLEHEP